MFCINIIKLSHKLRSNLLPNLFIQSNIRILLLFMQFINITNQILIILALNITQSLMQCSFFGINRIIPRLYIFQALTRQSCNTFTNHLDLLQPFILLWNGTEPINELPLRSICLPQLHLLISNPPILLFALMLKLVSKLFKLSLNIFTLLFQTNIILPSLFKLMLQYLFIFVYCIHL